MMSKNDAMPLIRVPVPNETATRKCPSCKQTMFHHAWSMESIGILLYKPYCPSCGQKLDWEKFVNVGGTEE